MLTPVPHVPKPTHAGLLSHGFVLADQGQIQARYVTDLLLVSWSILYVLNREKNTTFKI